MIPPLYSEYVILSIVEVEKARRVCLYCTTFDSMQEVFSDLSGSDVATKAIAYASIGFGMSFFVPKNAEVLHCGFAVLPGCAIKLTPPNWVITQLNA